MTQPIRDLVHRHVLAKLDQNPTLVWYDPVGDLSRAFETLPDVGIVKVDGRGSPIRARQRADEAWSALWTDADAPRPKAVVVYVPYARPTQEEGRFTDLFEAWAQMGATFGDQPEDALPALARRALPSHAERIDQLVASGTPNIGALEALAGGTAHPQLRRVFGGDDPLTVCVEILSTSEATSALRDPLVRDEALLLLGERLGFVAPPGIPLAEALAQWILFSEFCFDVGDDRLPIAVARIPRAAASHRITVFRIADQLRKHPDHADLYRRHASEVEARLHLGQLAETAETWGVRDTFAAEDTAALRFVVQRVADGDAAAARTAAGERQAHSFWRRQADRHGRWNLVFRVLDLVDVLERWFPRAPSASASVVVHAAAYADEAYGLWHVDRAHRWVERSIAELPDQEHVGALIELSRRRWWAAIDEAQGRFLEAVRREGWPPSGLTQREVYEQKILPHIQANERAALFLVDGCTFEMGRDLGRHLEEAGDEVQVEPVWSVVPSTTEFGMAAFLPPAAGKPGLAIEDGQLLPARDGRAVPDHAARADAWRRALGDRVALVDLEDLLGTPEQVRARIGKAPFVLVRSQDPDRLAEAGSGPMVWRGLTAVLDDLVRGASALARAGVSRMAFSSDHGHVLLPQRLAGEAVKSPAGDWLLEKRRLRAGTLHGSCDGCIYLKAAQFGWPGSDLDMVVASGFRTFQRNTTYFHEGVSLQELIVPLVSLRTRRRSRSALATTVEIESRRDRFIQRIFQVRLVPGGLFAQQVRVRVRVVDPSTRRDVGRVADCDALEPDSGLVRISGAETILLQVNDDHAGDIEISVLDPSGSGAELGRRVMKNGCLD